MSSDAQMLSTQASTPQIAADRLFRQVESYDWQSDAEFQSGLAAILGPAGAGRVGDQTVELTLRARCFYFTRKYGTPIDYAAYTAWRAGRSEHELSSLAPANPAPPITSSEPATPEKNGSRQQSAYGTPSKDSGNIDAAEQGNRHTENGEAPITADAAPASFAEVMELIQSGQPIPGIKEIPNTVLEGQGTSATKSQRRKPWERE